MILRKKTRPLWVGDVQVGGDAPVSVQSMTNTDTADVEKTVQQITVLEQAGCEIIRVAVPDMTAARSLQAIREQIAIPLIADIHFDYRLATAAMEHGAQAIRINPGNLGGEKKLRQVIDGAKMHGVPVRVGVNSGSIEKDLLRKYGYPTADNPQALVESALRNVDLLEKQGFYNMKISIKSSDVLTTINGYRELARLTDYPLHIGVTEAGGLIAGCVKSSVALGILLAEGIGDTLRISLTRPPIEEVRAGFELLRALRIRERGVELISCPTCGRTSIDLFSLAREVEDYVQTMKSPLKVAVMGCAVNGPGEAREADIGVAGGKGIGIIFKKGKLFKKVSENELLDVFMNELKKMDEEYRGESKGPKHSFS
ncbi:MAG: flavodoxin-dependent (E)-4-hydroxy-3-methylbut-2-enyl-diphosphate synthase [Desulfopila sp.]|jgi:(E)-4-hydroxy-3-methylbut-2-enyl-diphosphate synthase|nr:flavodoxin-dependent (E)-4-hydroxy-3-methylbut-2-enyl-diphosphate synthase [Desulfopila sp.]